MTQNSYKNVSLLEKNKPGQQDVPKTFVFMWTGSSNMQNSRATLEKEAQTNFVKYSTCYCPSSLGVCTLFNKTKAIPIKLAQFFSKF